MGIFPYSSVDRVFNKVICGSPLQSAIICYDSHWKWHSFFDKAYFLHQYTWNYFSYKLWPCVHSQPRSAHAMWSSVWCNQAWPAGTGPATFQRQNWNLWWENNEGCISGQLPGGRMSWLAAKGPPIPQTPSFVISVSPFLSSFFSSSFFLYFISFLFHSFFPFILSFLVFH